MKILLKWFQQFHSIWCCHGDNSWSISHDSSAHHVSRHIIFLDWFRNPLSFISQHTEVMKFWMNLCGSNTGCRWFRICLLFCWWIRCFSPFKAFFLPYPSTINFPHEELFSNKTRSKNLNVWLNYVFLERKRFCLKAMLQLKRVHKSWELNHQRKQFWSHFVFIRIKY